MGDAKKEKLNRDLDGALEWGGYAPDAIVARELAMAKGLGGGKKAAAAAKNLPVIRKVAAPLEAATYVVEAGRLIGDADLRQKRMDEFEDSGDKGALARMWDGYSNPIGTIYAAGNNLVQTAAVNMGEVEKEAKYQAGMAAVQKKIADKKARLALEEAELKKGGLFENQWDWVDPVPVKEPDPKADGMALIRSYLSNQGLLG